MLKKEDIIISLPSGVLGSLIAIPPRISVTASFAQDWFIDALNEARNGIDYNAKRREILFSVCVAESYFF